MTFWPISERRFVWRPSYQVGMAWNLDWAITEIVYSTYKRYDILTLVEKAQKANLTDPTRPGLSRTGGKAPVDTDKASNWIPNKHARLKSKGLGI